MRTYHENDLVLARLEGYPWWPGRIATPPDDTIEQARRDGEVYTPPEGGAWVHFFGDSTYAVMSADSLKPFPAGRRIKQLVERVPKPDERVELVDAFFEASQYLVDQGEDPLDLDELKSAPNTKVKRSRPAKAASGRGGGAPGARPTRATTTLATGPSMA